MNASLLEKLKAGKVKVTDKNYLKVSTAFCEAYFGRHLFKLAHLEQLPDPEGIFTEGPELFEQWIIAAFIKRGVKEKDVKARIEKLKSNLRKRAAHVERPTADDAFWNGRFWLADC